MMPIIQKWFLILLMGLGLVLVSSCGKDNKTNSEVVADEPPKTPTTPEPEPPAPSPKLCGNVRQVVNFSQFKEEVRMGNFANPRNALQGTMLNGYQFNQTSAFDSNCRVSSGREVYVFYERSRATTETGFWNSFKSLFSFNWSWCWNNKCSGSGSSDFAYRRIVTDNVGYDSSRDRFFEYYQDFGPKLRDVRDELYKIVDQASRYYKCVDADLMSNRPAGCLRQDLLSPRQRDQRTTRYVVEVDKLYYMIDTSLPLHANPIGIYDMRRERQYFIHGIYIQ